MLTKTLKALFLTACSAVYIEEFDQQAFAQTKQDGCVDCGGDVECEYDQVVLNGWGNINGRLAQKQEDGWIKVTDAHLRPCHVRMDKDTIKNGGTIDDLKSVVSRGYNDDLRPRSDMDGFSLWERSPRDYQNGRAGYFDCQGEGWTKVLSEMYHVPGKDLYLYRKDSKDCWPGHGGVCGA